MDLEKNRDRFSRYKKSKKDKNVISLACEHE
jgi:hypothetical protein